MVQGGTQCVYVCAVNNQGNALTPPLPTLRKGTLEGTAGASGPRAPSLQKSTRHLTTTNGCTDERAEQERVATGGRKTRPHRLPPPPQHARTRSRRHGRSSVSCPCCARRRACGGGAVPLPPPPVVASGGAAAVAQVAPPRQVHWVSALARWRRTRWMAREIVTGDSVGRGAALTWADGQPMGLGPAP